MAERYMINGGFLRAVFGRHAAKKLQRIANIGLSTAKLWLGSGVPAARVDEMRRELSTLLHRQIEESNRLLRELDELGASIRGNGFENEMAAGARRARQRTRAPRARD